VAALLLAVPSVAYPFLIEPSWLEVTHHRANLPIATPVRIALLSDLHLPGVGRLWDLVPAALLEAQVDLIVVAGDLVGPDGDRAAVTRFLGRLPRTPLGTYVVPGNWEYWALGGTATTSVDLGDGHWLVNQPILLRPDLTLIGLDDELAGQPQVRRALAGTSTQTARVAVLHSPSGAAAIDGQVDLVLAGHTHGGQVRLPGLGALFLPPGSDGYEAGWYRRGPTPLYVSRGLGMSVLPVRLFCRPELAIFDLVPQANLQNDQ
jgi:predicted MPP superfamily phosphohydrolase